VPIKRHIKIKGEANPFDPKFETYFEERSTSKMRDTLKGSKKLLSLWLNQGSVGGGEKAPIMAAPNMAQPVPFFGHIMKALSLS
jgi:hypothetical protein